MIILFAPLTIRQVLNGLQFYNFLICRICPNIRTVVHLLKTKACITVNNVFLSKQCLTRLIFAKRAIHSDSEVVIWLSHVKFGSKITPISLADCTGEMSFPNNDKWNSWSLEVICRLPKTINFVLSGFSSSRFAKHQLRTCNRDHHSFLGQSFGSRVN